MKEVKNLKELEIHANKLKRLSTNFFKLKSLERLVVDAEQLEELHLLSNLPLKKVSFLIPRAKLPVNLLDSLKELKEFYLSTNSKEAKLHFNSDLLTKIDLIIPNVKVLSEISCSANSSRPIALTILDAGELEEISLKYCSRVFNELLITGAPKLKNVQFITLIPDAHVQLYDVNIEALKAIILGYNLQMPCKISYLSTDLPTIIKYGNLESLNCLKKLDIWQADESYESRVNNTNYRKYIRPNSSFIAKVYDSLPNTQIRFLF